MTVKPQEVVDEEDAKVAKAQLDRDREASERSPGCRETVVLRNTLQAITDARPTGRWHPDAMSGAHCVTPAIGSVPVTDAYPRFRLGP